MEKKGEKKKRVLLTGPLPPPIGGDTVSTYNLFKSVYWSKAGITLDMIDTSSRGFIRVHNSSRPPGDILRAFRIFFSFTGKVFRARAVLFWVNSSFVCSIGIPLIGICILTGKPFVIKSFGSFFVDKLKTLRGLRRNIVIKMIRKADLILPQTAALESDLIDGLQIDRSRIARFPNFIPDSMIPDRMPSGSFSGRGIFIGQIKREKGVFDIIEAVGNEAKVRVDFFGDILPRDKEPFDRSLEANTNCRYGGRLQPDEVIGRLSEYDFLLLPTYHEGEGHPAVILQAFAAGVPVIATRWKSIPELVEDGRTGILVPVKSPEEIGKAMARLAGDREFYDSIAARAFERAGEFTEKRIVGRLLDAHIARLV
ncbi:MAG: glycosyltransferase family 4 protein [Candidatus Krumholzibacteriota bacterium]|nr:glycosyltransferase family 4 protein [Candidatus Krumholzibacteriota bacterium]